jgi:hypothetical protein
MSRTNPPRHCEHSEAIQDRKQELDCFVARAPRDDGDAAHAHRGGAGKAPAIATTPTQRMRGLAMRGSWIYNGAMAKTSPAADRGRKRVAAMARHS